MNSPGAASHLVTTPDGRHAVTTWLVGGLCLLPEGDGHRPARCDIELAHGCIAAVHPASAARACAVANDEVIDAADCLVLPGLVNAHTHSPDNLLKGTGPQLPLELWSLHCAAGRESRSPREVYVSTLLGCIEMLHAGTTTVLDHVRFFPHLDQDHLDSVAQAYLDAGLRAIVAPVVADRPLLETLPMEPTDYSAGSPLHVVGAPIMAANEQVERVEAFIERWHDADGRLQGAVGPSGPQRCTDRLLELCADLSRRRGVLVHTHLLETRVQQQVAQRLYGRSMVCHLESLGLLTPRTNLVHAVWVDKEDIERIARSGAAVVHVPVSNAKLGSGICPLPAMLGHRVRVALGTDSACCNDSNNILETTKWASLLHRVPSLHPDQWVGPQAALRMATRDGASVLGLGEVTGAITPGMAADLTLFRLRSPGMVPLHDPVQQLVHSQAAATAARVMVGGRTVAHNGRCLRIAEQDIWDEAQDFANRRKHGTRDALAPTQSLTHPIHSMVRRVHGLDSKWNPSARH